MYITVEHKISDPGAFWKAVEKESEHLPPGLKLHQAFPSEDGTRAVCLWEAPSIDDVRAFVEETVGEVSDNTYFAVGVKNAVGLPRGVMA